MWNHRRCLALFCFAAALCRCVAGQETKLPLDLTIEAGGSDRVDAIASFPLPESLPARKLRLVETTGGKESPVATQIDQPAGRLYWIANGKTEAGSRRMYRLEEGMSASATGVVVSDSPAV